VEEESRFFGKKAGKFLKESWADFQGTGKEIGGERNGKVLLLNAPARTKNWGELGGRKTEASI